MHSTDSLSLSLTGEADVQTEDRQEDVADIYREALHPTPRHSTNINDIIINITFSMALNPAVKEILRRVANGESMPELSLTSGE